MFTRVFTSFVPSWLVGRSVCRSILVKLRGGESCPWRMLGFFIGNYLFLHPSSAIRTVEIKGQINVSWADGPNVRTENSILACCAARLVRVSSLPLIASSLPFSMLSFDLSTRVLHSLPSLLTIFLLFSHSLLLLLFVLLVFRLRIRIRTSIEIGP